jgi:UPF0755 protein
MKALIGMYGEYKKHIVWSGAIGAAAALAIFAFVIQYSRSPDRVSRDVMVTIPAGSTVSQAGDILERAGVVRSHIAYRIYTIFIHDGSGIKAGTYLFEGPESVVRVAYRTAYGIRDLAKIKVTIPEGSNSTEITALLGTEIPGFATSTFLVLARLNEGYLFPDTYYFDQNTTPKQAVDAMYSNFDDQTETIASATDAFTMHNGASFADIVTMASIVEKEATSMSDREIIAGILWKRLAAGYPLQVDPPFYYILGKDSAELTAADLAIDSPYNLYKHKGLPPTPIDDPGLSAIYATVNPTATKYWYYLSDAQGNMHYAATYAQHLANKAKYVD